MISQLRFEDAPRYHGPDVTAEDAVRFKGAKGRIYEALKDGAWLTLRELSRISGALETSVSARIREFPHERKLIGKGLYAYRILPKL